MRLLSVAGGRDNAGMATASRGRLRSGCWGRWRFVVTVSRFGLAASASARCWRCCWSTRMSWLGPKRWWTAVRRAAFGYAVNATAWPSPVFATRWKAVRRRGDRTRPGGYLLKVEAEQLDAAACSSVGLRRDAAAESGDAGTAGGAITRGAGVVAGSAAGGPRDAGLLQPEIRRLAGIAADGADGADRRRPLPVGLTRS